MSTEYKSVGSTTALYTLNFVESLIPGLVVVVGCPARKDLAVSTRKATEEAAQVGAGPEWEGQRKEESEEIVKRPQPLLQLPIGRTRFFYSTAYLLVHPVTWR